MSNESVLNHLKDSLSMKGYGVKLENGSLSVFRENREVTVKEIKKLLSHQDKGVVSLGVGNARFQYVIISIKEK